MISLIDYFTILKLLFILSRIIIIYYIDPAESYSFAVISMSIRYSISLYININKKISFSVSMICLLMVPIDVFVTSHPVK